VDRTFSLLVVMISDPVVGPGFGGHGCQKRAAAELLAADMLGQTGGDMCWVLKAKGELAFDVAVFRTGSPGRRGLA